MGKGKKYRNDRTYVVNRASSRYQQNIINGKLKAEGIEKPKKIDLKKMKKRVTVALIIWALLLVGSFIVYRLNGLLAVMIVGLISIMLVLNYLNRYENKTITYYKAMGVTKNDYIRQMMKVKKLNTKRIDKISKLWDKNKQHSVI